MSKIVNISQPVRSAVLTPVPVYSRVIALELHLPAGIGNADYCYTPKLGNRTWLLAIDLWAYCGWVGVHIGGFFYFTYGSGEPATRLDVSVGWAPIVPLYCGSKPGFKWMHCDEFHRRFTMARLFTNDELRFGVAMENGFNQAWEATVAFQIAEG